MGSEETQYYIYYGMYSRSEIVALSAWPPGVNKLCVCVCIPIARKMVSLVECLEDMAGIIEGKPKIAYKFSVMWHVPKEIPVCPRFSSPSADEWYPGPCSMAPGRPPCRAPVLVPPAATPV